MATAQAHVMEVSQGGGICADFCIRRILCRHVTIGTPMVIFAVLTVTGLPRLYQQCTNNVPIVKNSQKTVKTVKMAIGVPIVTCLPRLYQQCTNRQKQSNTVKRQSKQQK